MYVFRYDAVDDDPALLETWLDLRKALYLDEDLIVDEDLDPAGRYVDEFDQFSEHILLFDQAAPDEPIGTCRIIDGRQTKLQVQKQFGVQHSDNAIEVSGFAVVPAYRKTFASLGCYRYIFARARGEFGNEPYDEVHFEVELPFMHTLAAIGLPLKQMAEEQFVYGAINVPLLAPPDDWIESFRAADARRHHGTRFAELFERPFNGLLITDQLFGRSAADAGEAIA